MTVTCNETILKNVELLSGLNCHVANIFLPPLLGMWHRNVTFGICYSSCPLGIIQPCLKKLLVINDRSKFIIYSNCRVKIEGIHSKLSLWLDTNDFHLIDTVSWVGTLTPEQKVHHIKAFFNSAVDSDFHPRILSATSGAANAGIDSVQVYGAPGCFHVFFEQQFSSPFWSGPLLADPCGNRCSFCEGTYDQMFPHISSCHGIVCIFFGLLVVRPSVILDIHHIATVIDSIKAV
jgi:hypothetical protein